jgi:hypothetical protein
MPKPLLYAIVVIETVIIIGLGIVFMRQSQSTALPASSPTESAISLSARDMTVYVKTVGIGERATDVVGKVYLQDDATGRTEFLFDIGAGCFPTWTLNTQEGYNLLVAEDVDIASAPLETLMKDGALRYQLRVNGDLEISKIMGTRSAKLTYGDQMLRLNQQCS